MFRFRARPSFTLDAFLSDLRPMLMGLYGGFFLLLGLYVMASLLSYDSFDPSWNLATEHLPQNWMGSTGAVLADFLIQLMGKGAFVFYVTPIFHGIGYLFLMAKRPLWGRTIAFILFLFSLSLYYGFSKQGGVMGMALIHGFKKLSLPMIYGKRGAFILCFLLAPWALHTPKGLGAKILLPLANGWWQAFRLLSPLSLLKSLFRPMQNRWKKNLSPLEHYEKILSEKVSTQKPLVLDDVPNFEDPPIKDQEPRKENSLLSQLTAKPKKIVYLDSVTHRSLPPLDLLPQATMTTAPKESQSSLSERSQELRAVLDDFSVKGDVVKVRPGPVVTLFELSPAPGVKASRIIGLADDIARSMCAMSARISVIPGKNALGIELPNANREMVHLRELLASKDFDSPHSKLSLVLGRDIGGTPVMADLARMPHLLVAGTTGSGKSVAINTMILSLLYRLPPERCRMIMIDPKMLELSVYNGIPHLLSPVVTDPKKAIYALKWTVREMEDRYRSMSRLGVRNIEGYNQLLDEAKKANRTLTRQVQTGFDPDTGEPLYEKQELDMTHLPYIVVVVDEMADLMMVAGKEIESAVQRLAQMARAAGIHLIMATQRPSVDVITGTIKANFPTRISFQVTSKFDSRTILGEQGAEQLLGRGDMLFMEPGGKIQRVHGPFVSDKDVGEVVNFLKSQGEPSYIEGITDDDQGESLGSYEDQSGSSKKDQLYQKAVEIVIREGKASTSFVQRHLQVGYNKAAGIIEQMEAEGIISPANHVGKREVLKRAV